MKNLFCVILCFFSATIFAQQTITVTVDNIPNKQGKVVFGLYNEATFMKAAPVKSAEALIENSSAKVVFDSITPGTYAVLCYHDTNGNDKMDFQSNGMPLENFGASNNEMSMGPPSWEASKFEIKDEPIVLNIRF